MKKAQGLPITTIVIAALSLVVLVILFAITTGRLAIFTGAASECPGTCYKDSTKLEGTMTDAQAKGFGLVIGKSACPQFETKLRGAYIARVKNEDKKPIICSACCVAGGVA